MLAAYLINKTTKTIVSKTSAKDSKGKCCLDKIKVSSKNCETVLSEIHMEVGKNGNAMLESKVK